MPVVVAVAWRTLRAVDAAAVVHVRELELLRAIPMFAPLAPPTIERLSGNLVPVTAAAGSWVIREGEIGDRFYIVDAGEIEVEIEGRTVRREGPGASFGEIALLRNVPRTASVRAATDVRLLALERDVFLAAVAGHARSRTAADAVVAERLRLGLTGPGRYPRRHAVRGVDPRPGRAARRSSASTASPAISGRPPSSR